MLIKETLYFQAITLEASLQEKNVREELVRLVCNEQCHALGTQQKKPNLHVKCETNCDDDANPSSTYSPYILTAGLTGNHLHRRSWSSTGVT